MIAMSVGVCMPKSGLAFIQGRAQQRAAAILSRPASSPLDDLCVSSWLFL